MTKKQVKLLEEFIDAKITVREYEAAEYTSKAEIWQKDVEYLRSQLTEESPIALEECKKKECPVNNRHVDADKPKERWKPESGDRYWFITSDGTVEEDIYCCDNCDGPRYIHGNTYETSEAAEAAAKEVKELLLSLYTEKDEAESSTIISPVCLQCNQPGHSFCNKD